MGILIYSKEEAKRNIWCVEKFKKKLGVTLVEPNFDGDTDFVINRTNDYKISEKFEKRGIRCFNPSSLSRLANDKQACYDFMEKHNIEIMPTRYKQIPFVKKPVDGHGGQGVEMCNDIALYDDNFVCQKVANDIGRDLRIWVIGNKIIASILRVSDTDFRSNYCLGGNAFLYDLSKDEIDKIKQIISLIEGDYYGIDFVFNDGKIVFNEIEDTVGARMIYDKTNIDIISLYCDYIKANI